MNSSRRTNRLETETSPCLLQHAFNPVDLVSVGRRGVRQGAQRGKPVLREHTR
jgi:uncharacterized protein YyaL (SSP411 family)